MDRDPDEVGLPKPRGLARFGRRIAVDVCNVAARRDRGVLELDVRRADTADVTTGPVNGTHGAGVVFPVSVIMFDFESSAPSTGAVQYLNDDVKIGVPLLR